MAEFMGCHPLGVCSTAPNERTRSSARIESGIDLGNANRSARWKAEILLSRASYANHTLKENAVVST